MDTTLCPVCTLYLRPGMSLEQHLTSHPKQKVIEALIRYSQTGISAEKTNETSMTESTVMSMNSNVTVGQWNQPVPFNNHSFIYQQFMSSSGPQPILNINGMPQFVAVPTVFNPQMFCNPYMYQQQQQVQIVTNANMQSTVRHTDEVQVNTSAIMAGSDTPKITDLSTSNSKFLTETPALTNVRTSDVPKENEAVQTEPFEEETIIQEPNLENDEVKPIRELYTEEPDATESSEKPCKSVKPDTEDAEVCDEEETVPEKEDELFSNEKNNGICMIKSVTCDQENTENKDIFDPVHYGEFINNQPTAEKVPEFECFKDENRILMNMDKCSVVQEDYSNRKDFIDKLGEESMSHDSLDIQTDEKMPPKGELSEQESNGASEVWGKMYQEGTSGMSTSYDLLARESWEGSDCSDSEIPPLQSRIPLSDNAEEIEPKKAPPLSYSCSICGALFSCPKERRVHKTKEHSVDRKPDNFVQENNFELFSKTEVTTEVTSIKEEVEKTIVKEEEYLCSTCGTIQKGLKELRIHVKRMHRPSKNRYKCRLCQEEFPSELKYNAHLKVHPLECNICAKSFYRTINLQMHLNRHYGIKPHKCTVCSKAFHTKQKLQEHSNIHTGLSPIKCSMCDETFKRHSNLIQHRNLHHLNKKRKVKDYVCQCGEVFHSKNKFNWHKEIHDTKPKSCNWCNEKFVHMSSLTRHIRRAHNQRYIPEGRENENVECKVCKGVYLRSSLDIHMQTHTGQKAHVCQICGKEFTTKWNMKLHSWIHVARNSKPYRCEQCSAAFMRPTDYQAHMNAHRSIKPYTCNYCGCKFIRKNNCQRHVREHEESKSYVCTICNKSFHRSYYLKEHLRVHSGVRPYSCSICNKTSTTKSNHNKHMRIHHAREPVSTEG